MNKAAKKYILVSIALTIFVYFNAWCQFHVSTLRNSKGGYEYFLKRFPWSPPYSQEARERLNLLLEDDVWGAAARSDDLSAYKQYVRTYKNGKYLDKAKARIVELSDQIWEQLSATKSDEKLKVFISKYPESTKIQDAQLRLDALYNDYEWVKEQDKLIHYQRFISQYPGHAESAWIQKRIIDLEVDEISKGEYGDMPKADRVTGSGVDAEVTIENKTGYVLTVRYSGDSSYKITLPDREVRRIRISPGNYKVAASVNASNVRNYFGSESLESGQYSSSFHIRTSYH